jgi:hypothetical protein
MAAREGELTIIPSIAGNVSQQFIAKTAINNVLSC